MGKVLSFPAGITQEQWAKQVYDAIMQGDKVAVAINTPDMVLTAYWGCNAVDKQVLLGHIQVDVIHQSMTATYALEPLED